MLFCTNGNAIAEDMAQVRLDPFGTNDAFDPSPNQTVSLQFFCVVVVIHMSILAAIIFAARECADILQLRLPASLSSWLMQLWLTLSSSS
jgi:hypothetical protein